MKKIRILMIVLVTFLYPSIMMAEPFVIRFSHPSSVKSPKGVTALKFQELMAEEFPSGEVKVEVFPEATLYADDEIIEKLKSGDVEMGSPSISKITKLSKRLQVFDLPFIFVNEQAAFNFVQGDYGERILSLLNGSGIKGLGYLNNGMKQISSDRLIKLPSDIKDLIFRVQKNDLFVKQFENLGAKAIKASSSQGKQMAKEGTINAQSQPWTNMYTKGYYKYHSHLLEANYGYLGYMIITSELFWKKLPEEYQGRVKKVLKSALIYGNSLSAKLNADHKKAILDANAMEVHVLSTEERKYWVEAMKPLWKEYSNFIGSGLIDAAASSR